MDITNLTIEEAALLYKILYDANMYSMADKNIEWYSDTIRNSNDDSAIAYASRKIQDIQADAERLAADFEAKKNEYRTLHQ